MSRSYRAQRQFDDRQEGNNENRRYGDRRKEDARQKVKDRRADRREKNRISFAEGY